MAQPLLVQRLFSHYQTTKGQVRDMNKKTLFVINSFLEVVTNFTSIFATNTLNTLDKYQIWRVVK